MSDLHETVCQRPRPSREGPQGRDYDGRGHHMHTYFRPVYHEVCCLCDAWWVPAGPGQRKIDTTGTACRPLPPPGPKPHPAVGDRFDLLEAD